jgi:hypothetical protein
VSPWETVVQATGNTIGLLLRQESPNISPLLSNGLFRAVMAVCSIHHRRITASAIAVLQAGAYTRPKP